MGPEACLEALVPLNDIYLDTRLGVGYRHVTLQTS